MKKVSLYIRELQHAHPTRKKRVLVVVTAGIMTIIVTLWFVYLNATLPSAEEASRSARGNTSFFATIGKGVGVLYRGITNFAEKAAFAAVKDFASLISPIRTSRDFIIEKETPESLGLENFTHTIGTQ